MFFFKLYNWLKYKVMPSSFLFKNRLFIERDSKHRKIMNNFGLTFRNSKWSNYSNENVNIDFKKTYTSFMLRLIVALVFFFVFFFSIQYPSFYNTMLFTFWFSLDAIDYYSSFIIWSFISFVSVSFTKLYLLFVNYNAYKSNFSIENENVKYLANKLDDDFDVLTSKNDLNWFLYSWLNNLSIDNKYGNQCVELLFDSSVSKNIWNTNYNFFFNLNLTSFFLNLHNNDFYFYKNLFKNFKFKNSKNYFFFFDNTFLSKNYFSFIFSFYFKFDNLNNDIKNLDLNLTHSKWNLNNLFLKDSKNNFLIENKTGSFFLENSNFSALSSNTNFKNLNNVFFKNLIFSESLNSSFNFAKWNRWLYRYSLLHRKSIKFGQKLNFVKKLLNTGFYNSSIFKKNIWNSIYFNVKKINSSHMTTFFDSYFNDFNGFSTLNFFSTNNLNNSFFFNDRNNFLALKFLESSYFWYLKRFFLFNNLNNNNSFLNINLNVQNNKNYLPVKNKSNFYFDFYYLNLFFKNRIFFFKNLDFFNFFFSIEKNFYKKSAGSLNNLNDIFCSTSDFDLFSKENLTELSILSSTFDNVYLWKNYNFYAPVSIFYINKTKINSVWFNVFFNNLLTTKIDFFFFKDLILFSEIYNK